MRFSLPLCVGLALLALLVPLNSVSADSSPPAASVGPTQLPKVHLKGPFATIEDYCRTLRTEAPKTVCRRVPIAGSAPAGAPFDAIALVTTSGPAETDDPALGLHAPTGWWINEDAGLWGNNRGYGDVLDARWEAGQWAPRVRVRTAHSYWNKPRFDDEGTELDGPWFGEYHCVGSAILCGRDAGGQLGCSEPLPLAVSVDCSDDDGLLTPRWVRWERWAFRLSPQPIDLATWRLNPRGSAKRLLIRGAPEGLEGHARRIDELRGASVHLPF